MKFRCPYCGHDLGSEARALCPHCGKGIRIPDRMRPVPFRARKRAREARMRENDQERRRRHSSPAGFGRRPLTILLTFGVLALAGLPLIFGVKRHPGLARKTAREVTQEELNIFRVALEEFRADCGHYPDARSGLMALINNPGEAAWKGPYVTVVKPDAWRRRYVYEISDNNPVVLSLGPDGQRNTPDDLLPDQWESLTQRMAAVSDGSAPFAATNGIITVRIK